MERQGTISPIRKNWFRTVMDAYRCPGGRNDICCDRGSGQPGGDQPQGRRCVLSIWEWQSWQRHPSFWSGDIDRGGVFAQLDRNGGSLLDEDERELVKGLIINKFRGDKTILDPGVEMLESKCRIPVVGVAPYLIFRWRMRTALPSVLTDLRKLG